MTRYQPQWLQAGSYAASVDRRLISALWPTPATTGGAATAQAGTMVVSVAAGQAAVPAVNGTGSTLCSWDAPETVTVATLTGNNRIDLITVWPQSSDIGNGTGDTFTINVVQGTPAATPVAPATPAGQVALYQVYVTGGNVALVQANLTDVRPGGLSVGPGSVNRGQVRAYRNGAFTFPATALTVVNPLIYDTKTFDPGNCYNTATGLYTCPVAGVYLIKAQWSIAGTSGTQVNMYTVHNGVLTAFQNTPLATPGPGAVIQAVIDIQQCNAGDTLAAAGSSTPASLGTRANTSESNLSIVCLGPP